MLMGIKNVDSYETKWLFSKYGILHRGLQFEGAKILKRLTQTNKSLYIGSRTN